MRKLVVTGLLGILTFIGTAANANGESSASVAMPDEQAEPLGGTIDVTKDQCGSVLHVRTAMNPDKYQTITRGTWTEVHPVLIDGIAVWEKGMVYWVWKCGSTEERSGCPKGTKFLKVHHSTTSREIVWNCET